MRQPAKPSRVPSKSPTLMGRFFLWAIRPLAAAKNSQKTMTGQKTIAACPKSSLIELSALEPLRSVLHEILLPTFVVGVPAWMRSDQD